jgi:hypothetical protein
VLSPDSNGAEPSENFTTVNYFWSNCQSVRAVNNKDLNKSHLRSSSKKGGPGSMANPPTIVISMKKSDLNTGPHGNAKFSKLSGNLNTNFSPTNTNTSLNVKKR